MNEPRFSKASSAFTMTCAVEVGIRATPQTVWYVLTDTKGFPRWNSTVTGIEGRIRDGERLSLRVPGTSRTFTPKVSDVVPARRMTWSDGFAPVFKGVRTFVLEAGDGGSTHFEMKERFTGLVFALARGMLPDFQPIFVAFANDLKLEAERIGKS